MSLSSVLPCVHSDCRDELIMKGWSFECSLQFKQNSEIYIIDMGRGPIQSLRTSDQVHTIKYMYICMDKRTTLQTMSYRTRCTVCSTGQSYCMDYLTE